MKWDPFVMLPKKIFAYKLSPIPFAVYCYLVYCHNKQNGCCPSRRTISKACSICAALCGFFQNSAGFSSTQDKKEQIGILMKSSQVREINAPYPLHNHDSRSEFIRQSADFYAGFLEAESSEKHMSETTFAFLENELEQLESRIREQPLRMCAELELSVHLFASQAIGASDDCLEQLRKQCVSGIRKAVRLGFPNRSEFIDSAISECLSRDLLKEFTGDLSQF